ncbi:hypothetical protein [Mycobacteroides abscessus]|uniref:hypothetical protein n=1 Tax=Mycobacteroides abscessus TaxID=36809 RepID=UPI00104232A8|nr:hypothetical protein [Mycobacteroides abscessus]
MPRLSSCVATISLCGVFAATPAVLQAPGDSSAQRLSCSVQTDKADRAHRKSPGVLAEIPHL